MKGIDVSRYQGNIDWKKVKADGVEFAIIQAGFRGYATNGKLAEDTMFAENIKNAIDAGVYVGVYFFTQATTPEEAREEARYCLDLVRPYKLDFPVYIDTENSGGYPNGRADKLTEDARTAAVAAFCDEIEKNGYYAGIYASEGWFAHQLGDVSRYDKWVANWDEKPSGAYGMWQYSSTGRVDGISTPVDLNEAFKDYPTIIQGAGLNRPEAPCNDLQEKVDALQKQVLELTASLKQVQAEKKNILDRLREIIAEVEND